MLLRPSPGSRRLAAHCATLRHEHSTLAPCSQRSRHGLSTSELAVTTERRPALTAACARRTERTAGRDEETASGRTNKLFDKIVISGPLDTPSLGAVGPMCFPHSQHYHRHHPTQHGRTPLL